MEFSTFTTLSKKPFYLGDPTSEFCGVSSRSKVSTCGLTVGLKSVMRDQVCRSRKLGLWLWIPSLGFWAGTTVFCSMAGKKAVFVGAHLKWGRWEQRSLSRQACYPKPHLVHPDRSNVDNFHMVCSYSNKVQVLNFFGALFSFEIWESFLSSSRN